MLQVNFKNLTKKNKIQLLVYHILKILRKKNKSFYSCFILKLPLKGTIHEKEFIRLLHKFLAKIQSKEFYISVFEIEQESQQLQVKILISAVYSQSEITRLRELWHKFLRKENPLLMLEDFENCFSFMSIITTPTFLNDLFRLEESKDQVPFRLGTHDLNEEKKTIKGYMYSRYHGVFYGSGVFSAILQQFRSLLVQENFEAIQKRERFKRLKEH